MVNMKMKKACNRLPAIAWGKRGEDIEMSDDVVVKAGDKEATGRSFDDAL